MISLSGVRVAIAEDEPLLLHILCETLELAGAEVVDLARNLDGALALVRDDSIDVAVLDVDLEGERVWPAALAMRSKGIGVIFASASLPAEVPGELASLPFVRKPYGYRELLAGIAEAAGLRPALAPARPRPAARPAL